MKYLIIALLFISNSIFADNDNHEHNPHEVINVTEVTNITKRSDTDGVASAIASAQCHFDWTYSYQGCAALGTYDGEQAMVLGMAKRANNILYNATVGFDADVVSFGVGANWKF